jgi:uncharacterized protein DUF3592
MAIGPPLTIPRRYMWVSGAAFLLMGVAVLFLAVVLPLLEASLARSWQSVWGTLRDVHVACEPAGKGEVCYPHAEYVYRLPDPRITPQGIRDTGRVYTGTEITFADVSLSSEVDHVLILGRYHPGASVQVFYDPHKPWKAVLERRAPIATPTWWIGGIPLAGGGVILILSLSYRRALLKRFARRYD